MRDMISDSFVITVLRSLLVLLIFNVPLRDLDAILRIKKHYLYLIKGLLTRYPDMMILSCFHMN